MLDPQKAEPKPADFTDADLEAQRPPGSKRGSQVLNYSSSQADWCKAGCVADN